MWGFTSLERAAKDAEEAGVEVDWIESDMRMLPFVEEFDRVVMWGSTFGISDDAGNAAVLDTVFRALDGFNAEAETNRVLASLPSWVSPAAAPPRERQERPVVPQVADASRVEQERAAEQARLAERQRMVDAARRAEEQRIADADKAAADRHAPLVARAPSDQRPTTAALVECQVCHGESLGRLQGCRA